METPSSRCSILSTTGSFAPTVLRLALGITLFPHGAGKLLGWFGGYGYSGTIQFFTGSMHIPWIFAVAAILVESFGSVALILGVATRIAALLVGIELFVAMMMVHAKNGFFMNWSGMQKGEGIEYFILVYGIVLALVLKGGGALSVDRALAGCPPKSEPAPSTT